MLGSGEVGYVQANFATPFTGSASCSATVREDVCVNFRVCVGPNVHNLQTMGQLTTVTSYSKLPIYCFPLFSVAANSLPQSLSFTSMSLTRTVNMEDEMGTTRGMHENCIIIFVNFKDSCSFRETQGWRGR
jgi:hypothetical protein